VFYHVAKQLCLTHGTVQMQGCSECFFIITLQLLGCSDQFPGHCYTVAKVVWLLFTVLLGCFGWFPSLCCLGSP